MVSYLRIFVEVKKGKSDYKNSNLLNMQAADEFIEPEI
jgi:hypothetical protein